MPGVDGAPEQVPQRERPGAIPASRLASATWPAPAACMRRLFAPPGDAPPAISRVRMPRKPIGPSPVRAARAADAKGRNRSAGTHAVPSSAAPCMYATSVDQNRYSCAW
ncbi:hypothetical protein F8568_033175 [Actinomadura sp. LD22]|uniref:Uncharacterized protein n=1 Tax=Actinomadura physcomitrii TaxID=2650748 RepID=A0A6I4MLX6_9ACTN|nr:hypothetical protein [Actinomadura physcomitrii]MWA05134.1 hypothetical protein [Actinomadura physcomitrii]